jgi:predicted AAA+ superfamily ATPase
VRRLLADRPVVAILGARRIGKTTLARAVARTWRGGSHYFDLEDPNAVATLSDPRTALGALRGLVVLDEVQCRPELFPVLRVLADREDHPARFLVLGSASPRLLRQTSESLAGRLAHYEMGGLSVGEVGPANLGRLWLRGGYPSSFLARDDEASFAWREDFTRTYLDCDLPQFGISIPAPTLRRFWQMLAHWHGQVWNSSEFARSFGVGDKTVRSYLDLLTATFVVQQVQPWHANVGKRQVKAPRVYLADTGMLHALLGLRSEWDVTGHPKCGASWEWFAIQEVVRRLGADPQWCFFWRTQAGAELDLLVVRGNRRLGFEVKRTTAPEFTKSMAVAREDLKLDSLDVIHAGEQTFPMRDGVRAVALGRLLEDVEPLATG